MYSAIKAVVVDINGHNDDIRRDVENQTKAAIDSALAEIVAAVEAKGKEINHKLETVVQSLVIVPCASDGKYVCTVSLLAGARDLTVEGQIAQQQQAAYEQAMMAQMTQQRQGVQPNIVIPQLRPIPRKR